MGLEREDNEDPTEFVRELYLTGVKGREDSG